MSTVILNTGTGQVDPSSQPPEGHDAAMAAKFDAAQAAAVSGGQPPAQGGGERPAWLPEKFASAEDLAKAYAELEKKQGGGQPQAQPKPQVPPAVQPGTDTQQDAQQQLQAKGFDYAELGREIAETGTLSEDRYKALEAAGFSKAAVDAHVEGQIALAEKRDGEVFQTIGGPDSFKSMAEWAAKGGMQPAEIDAFNRVMNSSDQGQRMLAARGLKAAFEAANGRTPNLVSGGTAVSSGDVFRSTTELTVAMSDPRYKNDPAYRNDVAQKLGRSSIF